MSIVTEHMDATSLQPTPPLITLKVLSGNPPASLYPMQQALVPYADALTALWLAAWVMTSVVIVVKLVKDFFRAP